MCFSLEADLVAAVALVPVGVIALREVRHVREVPFASLPLLFALHQLMEAVVWAGTEGAVSAEVAQTAAVAYLVVAFPVLPVLLPLAVLMLEPRGYRWRVAPFVALGAVVATYFATVVVTGPIDVIARPHALTYLAPLDDATFWTSLYIVAVIGPSLLSGYRSIVAFGAVNLASMGVAALLYAEAFTSVWCVCAALSSVLVATHMVRRRQLPDADRLHGQRVPSLTP